MGYFSQRMFFVRAFFLVVSVVLMSDCALAHGMRYDDYKAEAQMLAYDPNIKPIFRTIAPRLMTLPEAISRTGDITPSVDQSRINITRAGILHRVDLSCLTRLGQDSTRGFQ
jgi:hypothetical protein